MHELRKIVTFISDLMWCHRLLCCDDWISKMADMLRGF